MSIQKIKMLPKLMERIRRGKKTATTRLGLKNYTLGRVLFVNSEDGNDVIAGHEIYKIERVAFCDISNTLAREEGYQDATELRKVIEEIYKDRIIDDCYTMTVAYFYDHRY